MVFKRKIIGFSIFLPKASSVKLNFFTCYISLLTSYYYFTSYYNESTVDTGFFLEDLKGTKLRLK